MIERPAYTTQLQAGLGLVNETLLLLDLWSQGMSGAEVNKAALRSEPFQRCLRDGCETSSSNASHPVT